MFWYLVVLFSVLVFWVFVTVHDLQIAGQIAEQESFITPLPTICGKIIVPNCNGKIFFKTIFFKTQFKYRNVGLHMILEHCTYFTILRRKSTQLQTMQIIP